jgi:two-component system response regulator RegA
MPEKTILLVDDEELFRERLAKAFQRRDFTVFSAADYDEAVALIAAHKPLLAVVDLKMPGKSGLELIAEAKKMNPEMRIVVLTGYGSIATATEAVKLGALYYLPKPADLDDILAAFSRDPDLEIQIDDESIRAPSLARAEWEHINRVLADCGGNISYAAKRLGIHRRTLQRKLQKYPPAK